MKHKYVLLPNHRNFGGNLAGSDRHLRAGVDRFCRTSRYGFHLRKPRAVYRPTAGECRAAAQRRYAALAAQHFLDAAGDVMHALEDRAVSVDVLRSLRTSAPAHHLWRE